MVKVLIEQEHNNIMQVTIKGHADADEHGKDLVCAGISSIAVGMMNALDGIAHDTCNFIMSKGHIRITVTKVTIENQLLMKAMICQCKTLEETYSKYIIIKEQEV